MAKNNSDSFLNWHPDFCIQATLPDVKVIRTGFLVNFIALTCPLLLGGLIAFNWLEALSIQEQIEDRKQTIQTKGRENAENVKMSKQFDVASAKLTDINNFLTRNLDELAVVVAIAESRPKEIALSKISYLEQDIADGNKSKVKSTAQLVGVLRGISAEDVVMLDVYKSTLEKLDVFQGMLANVTLPPPTLDSDRGLSKFNITIDLKAVQ